MGDDSSNKFKSYKWTPSPAQHVVNGRAPMGQRVVGKTAEGKEIAVPHLYYEEWIDEAGNLLNVPMKTNRVTEKRAGRETPVDDSNYYFVVERRLKRKGWLKRSEVDPAELESIVAERRAAHAAAAAQFNETWLRDEERKATAMGNAMAKALAAAGYGPPPRDGDSAAPAADDKPARRKLIKDE